MMEAVSISKMQVNVYDTTRRNNPEDIYLLARYCSLMYTSFRFLRSHLCISDYAVAPLLTDSLSLCSTTTKLWLVPQSAPLKFGHHVQATSLSSSVCQDMISLTVCLSIRRSPSVFMDFVMWLYIVSGSVNENIRSDYMH
jgi:hypothetical protein